MASDDNATMLPVYDGDLASNDTGGSDGVSAEKIVLSLVYAIECIIGLVGNTLVIYVIMRYAKMKTVTNTYILNLAIADELFLLGMPFMIQTLVTENWPYGTPMCKIIFSIDILNQFTSIYFLTVMSLDRYMAVVHPVTSVNYRNPRNATIASSCVWILVLVLISPAIAAFRADEYQRDSKTYAECGPDWESVFGNATLQQMEWTRVFSYYTFLLGYILPLLIICTAYVLMLSRLRQVGAPGSRGKKTRKVTRMVTVVVGVFFLCWSPFYIMNLCFQHVIESVSQNVNLYLVMRILYYAAQCIGYANSCANPIIYAFLSDNFKKSFQKAFACATDIQFEPSVSHFRRRSSKGKSNRKQDTSNSMSMKPCQTHAIMLSESPSNGPAKVRTNGNEPEPVQL
ncbi:somatostatin receptor type 2-like [Glandiceps talaboti]